MSGTGNVVITGVSTGIGEAAAKLLVSKGCRVFGTVRKGADADRLQRDLGERFTPLLADVTDADAIARAAEAVAAGIGSERLLGLVNNAGIVVSGPLLHVPVDELRRQMETNVYAPVQVVQAFAGLLGADPQRSGKPGRVVQISSVAGKMGFPFVGPYVASKFALEGISEVLRRELMLFGVDVIVIGPGSVVTPIWSKAEAVDLSPYEETPYSDILHRFRDFFLEEGRKGLAPEKVAQTIYTALTASRPKVRYAVVPQRLKNWTLPRLLPKRAVDKALSKQFGLHP